MLVLTRKQGEAIRIGDVSIKVVKVGGNTVKIGVEAPITTRILRGELVHQEPTLTKTS
jgi:carbon storage regulator